MRVAETTLTQQLVHRAGMQGAQKLPLRIRPAVVDGAGYIDGTRCYQGDELVLVDGQLVLASVIRVVVVTEPMGKGFVD
ncbi:uncharacterized protein METZ01_LOCUS271095, partial [marine metagenome]